MVFIPGGGFGTGDGTPASFGAERFLDYEIVTFFKIKIYINFKIFHICYIFNYISYLIFVHLDYKTMRKQTFD